MKYSGEAQPVVYQGVLYIATGTDDVFALSLKSGGILWRYHANLDQSITTCAADEPFKVSRTGC